MLKMEKNKKVLYVIIVILVAIVCLLGGYIIGNNQNTKTNSPQDNQGDVNNQDDNNNQVQENNEHNNTTELSIGDNEVQDSWQLTKGIETLMANQDKEIIESLYKNDVTIINNLPTSTKIKILNITETNADKITEDGSVEYWNSDTVINHYKKIFGDTNSIKNVDYECMSFDNNGALKYTHACGGSDIALLESSLKKADKTATELNLYVAVRFAYSNDDMTKVYYAKDYNHTQIVSQNEQFDANYKYKFKKSSNGDYYFYSIEKI